MINIFDKMIQYPRKTNLSPHALLGLAVRQISMQCSCVKISKIILGRTLGANNFFYPWRFGDLVDLLNV